VKIVLRDIVNNCYIQLFSLGYGCN